jgi:diaminopimelate epimerase
MRFCKYHALGNDYIVLNPSDFPRWTVPTPEQTRLICHRNFGVGSDGILWGPLASQSGAFGVRIFNPDGSEAEKSGNGTRIFARFLWDRGLARDTRFAIETPGGAVRAEIKDNGRLITMDMGSVSFDSTKIPVAGPPREVINEKLEILDREFTFCAATIGNPHCVIPLPEISAELARRYGPGIEVASIFPRRTNVQFMKVLDRENLQIEIWERGAGYTLASGTSASAAAAVAFRLGAADRAVTLHMPGGSLEVEIGDGYRITMTGTVSKVAQGLLELDL